MTVAELIAKLQTMPQDVQVAVCTIYQVGDGDFGFEPADTVELREESTGGPYSDLRQTVVVIE